MEVVKLNYKKYIGERKDDIIKAIDKAYEKDKSFKMLIRANAGGGKTHLTMSLTDYLSNKYNYVTIFNTPNKAQAKQLGKQYKVKSVTSGVKIKNTDTKLVTVTDKTDEVKVDMIDKGVVLVRDEVHETISHFRNKATQKLFKLSEKSKIVIDLTATPRMPLEYFKYDLVIDMECNGDDKNIDLFSLIECEDVKSSSMDFIIKMLKSKKKILCMLNSKDVSKKMSKEIQKLGFKSELLNADTKDSQIYSELIENQLIDENYDIIFVTKLVENGINIRNKDIIPVEIIINNRNYNLDSTIQFFARLRNLNSNAFMFIKKIEEKRPKKELDLIKKELRFKAEMVKKHYSSEYLKKFIGNDIEEIKDYRARNLGLISGEYVNPMFKIVKVDDETNDTYIDEKALIYEAYKEYDRILVEYAKELFFFLKANIKSNKFKRFEYLNQYDIEESEEDKQNEKQFKIEQRQKALQIVKDNTDNANFIEWLYDDSIEIVNNSLKKDCKFLLEQEKVIKILRYGISKKVPASVMLQAFSKYDKDIDIKWVVYRYVNIKDNKNGNIVLDGQNTRNVIIRNIENLKKEKKSLTLNQDILLDLAKDLIVLYDNTKEKPRYFDLNKFTKYFNDDLKINNLSTPLDKLIELLGVFYTIKYKTNRNIYIIENLKLKFNL